MGTATQNVSIRVGVEGTEEGSRKLVVFGDSADKVFKKVKTATEPATKSLALVNVAGEQLKFGMEGLAEGSGTLGTSLMRLGPWGLAAAAAIGAVGIAVSEGLKQFKATEQAINSLNAALAATDSASGITTRSITELGEAVEKNTLFKKTDILQAAAALTSFQNVAGDTFSRALKLSTDLAVHLGTDVPSAAEMLGRALETPEEGLGRLEKKFSDLSPAQKETITNFVKMGDVASAQAVIMDHLESKTRGLAEAQTKGLTGSSNELHDAWESLLESIGRTVGESDIAQASLLGLTRVVNGLRVAIDPSLVERRNQLQKDIAEMSGRWDQELDKAVFGTAPNLDAKKEDAGPILEIIREDLLAEESIKTFVHETRMVLREKQAETHPDTKSHEQRLEVAEKQYVT